MLQSPTSAVVASGFASTRWTALTRYVTVDAKDLPIEGLLAATGSILMLALSVLALEYGMDKPGRGPDR